MELLFIVKTNSEVPMINTAKFFLPGIGEVVMDREETEYICDEIGDGVYRMFMRWRGCYIWDGENELPPKDVLPKDAELKFIEFDLEDEADEDYFVTLQSCVCEDFRIVKETRCD